MGQHTQERLIELAIKVGRARGGVDPVEISKVLTKCVKLSKTIAHINWDNADDKWAGQNVFIAKAEQLAASIGCGFRYDDQTFDGPCYLQIDDDLERLT